MLSRESRAADRSRTAPWTPPRPAGLASGDERVPPFVSRDTCSVVVAVIRSDRSNALEIVPQQEWHERQHRRLLLRASGLRMLAGLAAPGLPSKRSDRAGLVAPSHQMEPGPRLQRSWPVLSEGSCPGDCRRDCCHPGDAGVSVLRIGRLLKFPHEQHSDPSLLQYRADGGVHGGAVSRSSARRPLPEQPWPPSRLCCTVWMRKRRDPRRRESGRHGDRVVLDDAQQPSAPRWKSRRALCQTLPQHAGARLSAQLQVTDAESRSDPARRGQPG